MESNEALRVSREDSKILENAYKDTFSADRVNGELSEWFETVMRVLQGCVLSPLLFNIFLEMITAMALDESNEGLTSEVKG